MSIATLNILLIILGAALVLLLAGIMATFIIIVLDYFCARAESKNDRTLIIPDKRRGV